MSARHTPALAPLHAQDGHGFLTATAVASDVVGIIFVLAQAISLLSISPKFAASACSADDMDIALRHVAQGSSTTQV